MYPSSFRPDATRPELTRPLQILSTIFYPFDHSKGHPKRSQSGKYVMRLNFNGCLRKVVVDDRLPASLTENSFFVIDRTKKSLLWPALLEKAYLKIRGGYDFPGSNSGTDLWVLTGWIPEQVFLQRYVALTAVLLLHTAPIPGSYAFLFSLLTFYSGKIWRSALFGLESSQPMIQRMLSSP